MDYSFSHCRIPDNLWTELAAKKKRERINFQEHQTEKRASRLSFQTELKGETMEPIISFGPVELAIASLIVVAVGILAGTLVWRTRKNKKVMLTCCCLIAAIALSAGFLIQYFCV